MSAELMSLVLKIVIGYLVISFGSFMLEGISKCKNPECEEDMSAGAIIFNRVVDALTWPKGLIPGRK